jgi:hypothetical protein
VTGQLEHGLRQQLAESGHFLSVVVVAQPAQLMETKDSAAGRVRDIIEARLLLECERESSLSGPDVEAAITTACRQGAARYELTRLRVISQFHTFWAATLWLE